MYYLIFLAFDIQKLEIFLPHVDQLFGRILETLIIKFLINILVIY